MSCPHCGTTISLRAILSPGNTKPRRFQTTSRRSLLSIFFTVSGRIRRREFWAITLGSTIVYGLLTMGAGILTEGNGGDIPRSVYFGMLAATIGYFWVNLACIFQRWHDRNKSGFWSLVTLIPLVGWIWALIETGFLPGTPGTNRFGPPPR